MLHEVSMDGEAEQLHQCMSRKLQLLRRTLPGNAHFGPCAEKIASMIRQQGEDDPARRTVVAETVMVLINQEVLRILDRR